MIDLYIEDMNKWLRITGDPVFDKTGKITKAIHIIQDITELKQMDEKRFKSMMLESIGTLAE